MIYGWNFTGQDIPPGIKRKFAERKKLDGMARGQYALLKGACSTPQERDQMLSSADNGHRKLHVVQRHGWYGIYVY